jgi:hypothetical protein
MRTPNPQPRSLQACDRQVRGQVSLDAPPNTSSFFLSASEPTNPRSSVTRHTAITRLRHRTIAFPLPSSRFNTHSVSGIEAV